MTTTRYHPLASKLNLLFAAHYVNATRRYDFSTEGMTYNSHFFILIATFEIT